MACLSGPCLASKNGGAGFQNYGSHIVKSACEADFFTKIDVKSTVFELQKSYKHKSSYTINFLKNDTKKMFSSTKMGGRPPQARA